MQFKHLFKLAALGFMLFSSQAMAQNQPDIKVVPPTKNMVSESGSSQTFSVSLAQAPASKVKIDVSVSDATEGRVDKTQLEFLRENWNIPQIVKVTGVDDQEADGNVKFDVVLNVSYTKDNNYKSVQPKRVKFVNQDNEGGQTGNVYSRRPNGGNGSNTGNVNNNGSRRPQPNTGNSNNNANNNSNNNSNNNANNNGSRRPQPNTGNANNNSNNNSRPNNGNTNGKTKVRIVAANTSSGQKDGIKQTYNLGHGIRLFKAVKPDIVMIQEFNYLSNSPSDIKSFVTSTFGNGYYYHRGTGKIPNGIISKYPITSSGSWRSDYVSDRNHEWAVIDIPGPTDLLAVSVHLYTKKNAEEMEPLKNQIQAKIDNDKKNYYVVLGGDFNQPKLGILKAKLSSMFVIGQTSSDWPQDQKGNQKTNQPRLEKGKQIDYVLCNPSLCAKEVPTVIGKHSYTHGHVFDSRVYSELGELNTVSPVQADDSDAFEMQHMMIIRDFAF